VEHLTGQRVADVRVLGETRGEDTAEGLSMLGEPGRAHGSQLVRDDIEAGVVSAADGTRTDGKNTGKAGG
jgi:hypothetical protein